MARKRSAAAGGGTPAQGAIDDRLGATYAGLDGDRFFWTVAGASTAFHARVAIRYPGEAIVYGHNTMWTDYSTHPAPGTKVVEEAKCGHIGKVFHAVPPEMKITLTHRTMPITEAPIWTGTAILISFLTPEREV